MARKAQTDGARVTPVGREVHECNRVRPGPTLSAWELDPLALQRATEGSDGPLRVASRSAARVSVEEVGVRLRANGLGVAELVTHQAAELRDYLLCELTSEERTRGHKIGGSFGPKRVDEPHDVIGVLRLVTPQP